MLKPASAYTGPDVLTREERDILDCAWRSWPDASMKVPRDERGVHLMPFYEPSARARSPEGTAASQLAAYGLDPCAFKPIDGGEA